jgi:hypothetical protein
MPYDDFPVVLEKEKEHKEERTYHDFPGSKYILPADEAERER